MISNSDKKDAVKIAKETAAKWSTKNAYAVSNVNVAQGPKTGNQGLKGKRSSFIDAKESREPLAETINRAYGMRAQSDAIDRKAEGIEPIVKPRKLK